MMKRHLPLSFLLCLPLFISLTYSPPLMAASDDACAIWMCLPTGFGEGCDGPHREFRKRTLKHQPAMPRWSSCQKETEVGPPVRDVYTNKTGVAAVIPAHTVCARHDKNGCLSSQYIEEKIIKDRQCRYNSKNGTRTPTGCSHTLNYTEIYKNGFLFGKTAYY
ncbi:hypothetical protein [Aliivibrio salmonicida]|uniref:hypothetical protein n=1 Tax=Aliivibrio salmonicida TaxID=40269 RepID=UPI003D1176FB